MSLKKEKDLGEYIRDNFNTYPITKNEKTRFFDYQRNSTSEWLRVSAGVVQLGYLTMEFFTKKMKGLRKALGKDKNVKDKNFTNEE